MMRYMIPNDLHDFTLAGIALVVVCVVASFYGGYDKPMFRVILGVSMGAFIIAVFFVARRVL